MQKHFLLQLITFRWLQLLLVATVVLLGGCSQDNKEALLIYCGITMAHPINTMARQMEKRLDRQIIVTQGGSEDLYQSLQAYRKGDLYLPGSKSYRERHLNEGLLGDAVTIGFNQAAILVSPGNPKQVKADPQQLMREDLKVVICNPNSGSIGRETKLILNRYHLHQQVVEHSIYLTTDSRNLNYALKQGEADVTINWKATAFFPENRAAMQVLDLDPEVAQPKALVLNLLTFSPNQEAARAFMDYATSAEGQQIMRQWGFLDASGNKD